MSEKNARISKLVYLLLTLWTSLLVVWLYDVSVQDGGLASWDGYDRCAWASSVWYDIRHFEISLLWKHTNAQVVWPPLHSWITGLLFVLFNPSLQTARFVCLISFFLTGIFLLRYFKLDQNTGFPAGCLAWGLFTSSPYAVHHSVSIMSELPGLCLVTAVLFSLPQLNQRNSKGMVAGVLLGLLFLFKYNYAVLTYAGILLTVLIQSRFSLKAFFSKTNLYILGIPLIVCFFWFLPEFNHKLEGFLFFASNNPNARTPFGWESLWYYPSQIAAVYFYHPAVFIVSLILIAAAFIHSPGSFWKHPAFHLFWIHFMAAVFHPMKDIRFVFIPMGLFFLLAGISLQILITRFKPSFYFKIALTMLSILCAGYIVSIQFRLTHELQLTQENRHEAVYQTLLSYIEKDDYTGLLSAHDFLPPPALNFYLATGLDDIPDRKSGQLSRWSFLYLMISTDAVADKSVEESIEILRHDLFIRQSTKVIFLQSMNPQQISRFDEPFGGAYQYGLLLDQLPELERIYEHEFRDIDLALKIYSVNG